MFMTPNLIEMRLGKLIINHLIGNNCPEIRNRLLDSCLFKLTLGRDYLKLCFWQSFSKPSWLSNITKIPIAYKPEL